MLVDAVDKVVDRFTDLKLIDDHSDTVIFLIDKCLINQVFTQSGTKSLCTKNLAGHP